MVLLFVRISLVIFICSLCLFLGISFPLQTILPSSFIIALDLFENYHIRQDLEEELCINVEDHAEELVKEDKVQEENSQASNFIEEIILEENKQLLGKQLTENLSKTEEENQEEQVIENALLEVPPIQNQDEVNTILLVPNIGEQVIQVEQVTIEITDLPLIEIGNDDLLLSSNKKEEYQLEESVPTYSVPVEQMLNVEEREKEELEKIANNSEHFSKVEISFRKDPQFIVKALLANGDVLEYLEENKNIDREVLLSVIEKQDYLFVLLDYTLKTDREFVKKAFERNNYIFFYLEDEIKREVYSKNKPCILSILGDPLHYRGKSLNLTDDFEAVLKSVQIDGRNLRYASKRLRSDRKIISAAVRQNVEAIEFIDPDFKQKYGVPASVFLA